MAITDWISSRVFHWVHRNNLVYNTCWEDPRLDHAALKLSSQDHVLVITSAGCNALDYALAAPQHVYAVDMNPRQNALLELKMAGIRQLEYEDFFRMFGEGYLANVASIYTQKLRPELSAWAGRYWDRWITFFANPERPFYFRGTSGTFASLLNLYVDRVLRVREWLDAILAASSVSEQRQIYEKYLRDRFWTKSLKFAMGRDAMLSMVGVPRIQRQQVERDYEGGIVRFVQDCVEAVFTHLPLVDNYFWRVYLMGRYTRECCPEYLKAAQFQRLQEGLVDRVTTHSATVQRFLEISRPTISRFVLLDHMDWMSGHQTDQLRGEWQAIIDHASPAAKLIWRSGGLQTDFVDRVVVQRQGQCCEVSELIAYDRELAEQLHGLDRVHTYGSFHIARLAA